MALTFSRQGQANLSGDTQKLFQTVFRGEVFTQFDKALVTKGRFREENIPYGKAASFPILSNTKAKYHTVGDTITGTPIAGNEIIITIDQILYADVAVHDIDEAMNHVPFRLKYAAELGKALARTKDQHILQMAVLASRATGPVTGEAGGSTVTNATMLTDTTGEALVESLFAAAKAMDEKDIPEDGRTAFLTPGAYYILAQNTKIMNKDWGGAGVYADGKVLRVAGIEIVKTNNSNFGKKIEAGTVEAGDSQNKYAGDFTNTVGVVAHKDAVGTVTLKGLITESQRKLEQFGDLLTARFILGHGILRPSCAVELCTAEASTDDGE